MRKDRRPLITHDSSLLALYERARIGSTLARRASEVRAGASGQGCRIAHGQLAEKQAGFPANALGRGPKLFERSVLDLADALLADAEQVPDLPQAVRAIAREAEAKVEDLA